MADPRDVQFEAYVEAPFIQAPGLGGAEAGATVMVLPGITVDYQAYAAPPQAPVAGAATGTGGVAAMTQMVDFIRQSRTTLPDMGTLFAFLFTPLRGGSALSWVPVYGGRPHHLHPALQFPSHLIVEPIVPSPAATPLAWSARYPDRVGERPRGLGAGDVPTLFAGFLPITSPVADTTIPWWPQYPDATRRSADWSWALPPAGAFLPVEAVHPTPPVPPGPGFILDESRLGGPQYRTVPFDMMGEFRQIQLFWQQDTASQDMEPHYLEFHFTVAGVADEEV